MGRPTPGPNGTSAAISAWMVVHGWDRIRAENRRPSTFAVRYGVVHEVSRADSTGFVAPSEVSANGSSAASGTGPRTARWTGVSFDSSRVRCNVR